MADENTNEETAAEETAAAEETGMSIDEATLDAEVTGVELLPASDGGQPRAVSTAKIKDYVLAQIAGLPAASGMDASADGVYILKGGAVKPVAAATLAAAVLDVAYTLTQISTINGNETVALKDGNSGKKTATLTQLKTWIVDGLATTTALSSLETTVGNKVDKVEGKGLSKNDFTDVDKAKLDGLVGNVQPDWNQTDSTKQDYIKNKPTDSADAKLDSEAAYPAWSADGQAGYDVGVTVSHEGSLYRAVADMTSLSAAPVVTDTSYWEEVTIGDLLDEMADSVSDGLEGKVDKVANKGLSTNDYTTAEKNKLAGLPDTIPLPKIHLDENAPEGGETGYAECSVWIEQPSGGNNVFYINVGNATAAGWLPLQGVE